jgi:hypothetical protein
MRRRLRSRGLAFAAILAGSLAAGAGYVAWAALRGGSTTAEAGSVRAMRAKPHVVFENVRGQVGDNVYAHVALADLDEPSRRRVTAGLMCERVYFAAERGLCLISQQNVIGANAYKLTITGPDFKARHELKVAGIPIRARISPDGRFGATTGFVTGHSYADDDFSTKTVLIDMERGKVLADLEKDFTVLRNGDRIKEIDFNFWGVTFARQPGRFYATLGTGKKRYLLKGDVRTRLVRVIKEGGECPSISPDNTRVAYKKQVGETWRFHVLDLATMEETPLAEARSVDDQVEWLDNQRILYGLSPDIWVVPADGSGSPRKFLSKALSPAVVRNTAVPIAEH